MAGSDGDPSATSSMTCAASSTGFCSALFELGLVPPYILRASVDFMNLNLALVLFFFKLTALTVYC